MNILIYGLRYKLQELIQLLLNVKDISIFFAFNEDDAGKLINEVEFHLLLIGELVLDDIDFLDDLSPANPSLKIFRLDDINQIDNLSFENIHTHKMIKFNNVVNEIKTINQKRIKIGGQNV